MLYYILAEAVASDLHEIILISAPGKEVLERYVTLRGDDLAKALGNHPSAHEIKGMVDDMKVTIVHQTEPLGLGHAILQAAEAVGDEPFATLLPDDIIDGDTPALAQMLAAYQSFPGVHVAVERVPKEAISAYGVVDCEPVKDASGEAQGRFYRVKGLVEKPEPDEAPSDLGIVGRYLFPPEIFDAIRKTQPGAKGEIQITDAMEILREEGVATYAYAFEGTRYDVGNPLGQLRASVALGLKDSKLGPPLREYLQDILKE